MNINNIRTSGIIRVLKRKLPYDTIIEVLKYNKIDDIIRLLESNVNLTRSFKHISMKQYTIESGHHIDDIDDMYLKMRLDYTTDDNWAYDIYGTNIYVRRDNIYILAYNSYENVKLIIPVIETVEFFECDCLVKHFVFEGGESRLNKKLRLKGDSDYDSDCEIVWNRRQTRISNRDRPKWKDFEGLKFIIIDNHKHFFSDIKIIREE